MVTHGRPSTYNKGCRCDLCTDMNTARQRKHRERRARISATSPADVPHGLSGYVNWNCRCDTCKAAGREHFTGNWDISRSTQPWTDEDVHLAVRDDLPVREIAQKLKRPYQKVVAKRHALRKAA